MTRVSGRYPRIPCVVFGCKCGATCYPPGVEIICPKHYRLVDKSLKRLRREIRRAFIKSGAGQSPSRWIFEDLLWRMIVEQATHRAAGI
ncbi:hypothetical protein CPT_Sansa59 [Caulobacter phage Sansa]|uniref:Uncharacterized protein n=1 Tax=Caulobacter phage Sansa TaxID=1675600 RepID=A0A0K1LMN8_9CAUD|nr:hypothetical protein HOR07_gp059 [Caulobacter phage Sansa]AKU43463.1 hypothetical protein CPT_Sansa59 [Caulobacter phage Sansa]